MTSASVRAVAEVIRREGADAWFRLSPAQLLAQYDPGADGDEHAAELRSAPGGWSGALARMRKGPDILDVWFESGSSWNSCMRQRGLGYPVDLYLEGSDQHRGWFQLSLLPALGVTGRAPFKTLLTHGFMVDKEGKKLSKSKGDTVEGLMTRYGADVMRWWVSGLAYENDVKVDESYFDSAGESYRKVRNTLRFMLSNLYDFVPTCNGRAGHCVDLSSLPPTSLDAWVLAEFDRLSAQVTGAYERYDFRSAHLALYDFANTTLSAVYCAAIKDRMYCDQPGSARRRATQTVLFELVDGYTRLVAPILCHTADEAHRALWKVGEAGGADGALACVHLKGFIRAQGGATFGHAAFSVSSDSAWPKVMALRERAMVAIEGAKKTLGVENPLDMGVTLPDEGGELARFDATELADLFGVSRVRLALGADVSVQDLRAEPLCERSRKRDGTVKAREKAGGAMLSDRDAQAVGAV
jgi:isoleucyl-tRNA synthetase